MKSNQHTSKTNDVAILSSAMREGGETYKMVERLRENTEFSLYNLKNIVVAPLGSLGSSFEKDELPVAVKQISQYEIVVIATLTYCHEFSSLLQRFLERLRDIL